MVFAKIKGGTRLVSQKVIWRGWAQIGVPKDLIVRSVQHRNGLAKQ
jgi:hypothetical protein